MPTLTWTGKDEALRVASRVPFRLLEPHPAIEGGIVGDPEAARENLLIQGDNLDALKALLPYYGGKVKCIYIDPPYNTGSAFEHYDDNLEHSTWLSMMYPRLELLRELLAENGSIWVSVDDQEAHYLKVLLDEIFGRSQFYANVVWQKRTSPDFRTNLGAGHEHILVYAKNILKMKDTLNKLSISEEQKARFKNPDNDPRGPWVSTDFSAQGYRPNQMYKIVSPKGAIHTPPTGMCWKNIEPIFLDLVKDNRIWFGKNGNGVPRRKTFLSESDGITSWTWWPNTEVGHTQESKKEIIALFGADDAFSTPKPERLIKRILEIATNPGDLVLDSFLGSGTTAAVAQKMGRRWIGIEMGEHAVTHCLPRLRKVLDGEQGGISEAVGWRGGGGFRFAVLGETVFQSEGSLNPKVSFKALAAHIWWRETGSPFTGDITTPFLGVHDGKGFYLLYNGILGDRRPEAGNVLTPELLARLSACEGQKVVFAEACLIPERNLERLGVIFRQIPYDLGGLHV